MVDCPRCQAVAGVIDSRAAENNTIKRRRKCTACGFRFNTWESTVNQSKLVEQRRQALRAFKARLTPEERQERNKRDHLRRAARDEAKRTKEPVAAIYKRWGVE